MKMINNSSESIKLDALSRLVDHGMIKLYLDMAYSIRQLNLEQRNRCVIRYLKSAIKKSCYKPVKSSIRELIHYGKRPRANMEEKLKEVDKVITLTRATADSDSDLCSFMSILNEIEKYSPVVVEEFSSAHCLANSTYLQKGFLVTQFSDEGNLLNRIAVYIPNIFKSEVENILRTHRWQLTESKTEQSESHDKVYFSLLLGC